MSTIKTLAIQQPWAWLIVNGHKDIENRTWTTRYRGPLLIHASKKPDPGTTHWRTINLIELPHMFQYGGIIGIVDLVNVVSRSDSGWFRGPFGFVLANQRVIDFTPLRGQLGLFDTQWPPEPREANAR